MKHKKTIFVLATLWPLFMAHFTSKAQVANYANPYAFTTFAGQPYVSGTNDGMGNQARFTFPNGVAIDGMSNIYVADLHNSIIRKITPAGLVTTLAGTAGVYGTQDGTNGDAQFAFPVGIAVDSMTNIYVSDIEALTIRKITQMGTNWVVTTFAGKAWQFGSTDATGTSARFGSMQFGGPNSIAVDSGGNVYVADEGNHTIRKITPAGVVSTLCGKAGSSGTNDGANNNARFRLPTGVAVDSATNIYVADSGNFTIRKVTPVGTNWVVSTLVGNPGVSGTNDATNTAALFNYPNDMAVDSQTNLYVSDFNNNTVRKVSPVGTNWVVTTIAGLAGTAGTNDGVGPNALFYGPAGLAVDAADTLYVADVYNDTIRKAYPTLPALNASLDSDANIQLQFNGSAGSNYVLVCTTNLTPPTLWLPVATNAADANGNWTYTVTNSPFSSALFFRVAAP